MEQLDNFSDYYVDDDWEFDQEMFDRFVDREFPVIKIFLNVLGYFIVKYKINWNDSDSDDGVDSDDIKAILSGCEDSESDSDSD